MGHMLTLSCNRRLRPFLFQLVLGLTCLIFFATNARVYAQSLQLTFGAKGLQTLSYQGQTLEDVTVNPADSFHIWHMKATGLDGSPLSGGQDGWGEVNNGESWNPSTQTETYTFDWGSISVRFVQRGDNLDLVVTEKNNIGSSIIFDGAEIYPFALHFPTDPLNFNGYSQFLITSTGPGVSAADYGTGVVTSVLPDESVPMYVGWKSAGFNTYTPLMAGTTPDGLPSFLPHSDRPLMPGATLTYSLSLRFTPKGTAAEASDANASFSSTYPSQMTWTDKRIIGTAYLASAPVGFSDVTQPGGFPTNPRRYFNDPTVDVSTTFGLQAFQSRVLAQAAANVVNTRAMNGQGVITWDIEGEQFPQATSYVCSPDQIATVAPEMESLVTDTNSAYYGQKLDDAYFSIMANAGLRTGLCLRPQMFTLAPNGSATQTDLTSNAAIVANLENKARFANSRWGVTLFYVDSTVDTNGGTLDPAIFQQLITDLPAFLFIPEESTPRYYAYSAPFYSFLFHNTVGTPNSIYNIYPKAFGANLVNDVSSQTLAAYLPQLTQSVVGGDVLMGHADYWQANDPTLVSIYQAAHVVDDPIQVTPSLIWSAPAAIVFGTPLSSSQLNASASTTGIFTYAPSAGTLLGAGVSTLMTTFTPADTRDYKSATASVPITVVPAIPIVTWPVPAPITTAKPLGGEELNAAANIPGVFIYTPAAGTFLSAGSKTLKAVFVPADSNDYQTVSQTVTMTVTQFVRQAPILAWTPPAAIMSGTPLSALQLNASASVDGTMTYSPAAGSVLRGGSHLLTAIFFPADSRQYKPVCVSVPLTVESSPVRSRRTHN
jgi:hypothetical protein